MSRNLECYSSEELNLHLRELCRKEREIVSDVVRYLHEIDKRGYYRELGHSSLFAYCTQTLGYSEGAAQRRIQAARALGSNPEIYSLLREGKLTLSAIAEIVPVITPENKRKLLSIAQGKSKAEVQSIAAQYKPATPPKAKATVRAKRVLLPEAKPDLFSAAPQGEPKVETRFSISLEVDAEFMALYERAKALVGHLPMAEVLRRALSDLLDKRAPRESKRVTTDTAKGRYIPMTIKAKVHTRDSGQCTFVSVDGRRCRERVGLELDHIIPYALGGAGTVDNLRLLCPAHNRLLAERIFGEKVTSHRRSGGVC